MAHQQGNRFIDVQLLEQNGGSFHVDTHTR